MLSKLWRWYWYNRAFFPRRMALEDALRQHNAAPDAAKE